MPSNGDIFLGEIMGTAMLTLLGCGVVANVLLGKSKGRGADWLLINFGWGIAVLSGVYVAFKSGAYLNPAVVLGIWADGNSGLSFGNVIVAIIAEVIGAFLGAVLCWASYMDHFNDEEADSGAKLGVFSTGPAIRNYPANVITEVIGTFVLVFVILSFSKTPAQLGPIPVALLVVGIGASLGGPTGYAINPARDLGPRIAHFILPIRGKGDSDWGYSWVPIVGPIIGGVIGGVLANAVGMV
jgi:glycerol uptake facilitator protein